MLQTRVSDLEKIASAASPSHWYLLYNFCDVQVVNSGRRTKEKKGKSSRGNGLETACHMQHHAAVTRDMTHPSSSDGRRISRRSPERDRPATWFRTAPRVWTEFVYVRKHARPLRADEAVWHRYGSTVTVHMADTGSQWNGRPVWLRVSIPTSADALRRLLLSASTNRGRGGGLEQALNIQVLHMEQVSPEVDQSVRDELKRQRRLQRAAVGCGSYVCDLLLSLLVVLIFALLTYYASLFVFSVLLPVCILVFGVFADA